MKKAAESNKLRKFRTPRRRALRTQLFHHEDRLDTSHPGPIILGSYYGLLKLSILVLQPLTSYQVD